jgi:predicted O-methyltransferase YrrM
MVRVPLEVSPEVPSEVQVFLAEATRRIDAFVQRRLDDPIPGFVPSDFGAVWGVLVAIRRGWHAPGDLFLEWGSGLGVVAALAAKAGFQAHGIEIEPDLVREARRLAADHGLAVTFHEGSLVPEGSEDLVPLAGEFAWLDTTHESAYEAMGLDIDDFDVIFAYPWPGEEEVVVDLFARHAASGALLVTYQGVEGVLVRRKTRRRR